MLSSIQSMVRSAYQNKYAVPHFNISNLEIARYILEVCEEMRSPVVIAVTETAVKYMGGYKVAANLVTSLIEDLDITVPVGLILDHGKTFESCKKAIDVGFNGVMVGAPNLSIDENIELTNRVIAYARSKDVYVEGEIVADVDNQQTEHSKAECINDAIKLVGETDIDALAPEIGSSHGISDEAVEIDFESMEIISNNAHIPLVMHGGSGIPDHMIIKSITNGVAKINIDSEFRVAWTANARKFLNDNLKTYDLRQVNIATKEAIKEVARTKILLFGSNYKSLE